jgi:hypothetical protein
MGPGTTLVIRLPLAENDLTDDELRIIIVIRAASTLPLCGVLRLLFTHVAKRFHHRSLL